MATLSKLISDDRLRDLQNQIQMSKALLKEELQPIISENMSRYIGTYVPKFAADWDIVLNEIYPIVQYYMPALFFRNPRAFLKPRTQYFFYNKRDPLTGELKKVQMESLKSATTQESILNYGLEGMHYKEETRKVVFDGLLAPYGILWHGFKGDFGMTSEASMHIKKDKVFVQRVCPMKFIWDPAVNISNIAEARWIGRLIDMPLEFLIEDDKFDVDKALVKGYKGYGELIGTSTVNKMMSTGAVDYSSVNAARRSLIESTDKGYQNCKEARFVQVAEIFLRPTPKEEREGKKGTILVLTDEQAKPLRENEWKIKAEGWPAHILQFNELPDSVFGLSDPETYKAIADQKNVIVNLQLRNAQENSKVWVGLSKEDAVEEDIEHIRMGENSIIAFESGNPRDKMFVATPGGQGSSELYTIDQRIQTNLEDKSGVTDLKRGFLQSGEESAASVKIRNAGSSARPAYRQDIITEFLKRSLQTINQLNKQFIDYDEAVRLMGTLDIQWSENLSEAELQADVDIEIDAYSIQPEDPNTEMQRYQTVLNLMVEAINDPGIMQKLQEEGKKFNISPIIEQILLRLQIKNPDIFRTIKAEESQGMVSVQQLRNAKDNVKAAVQNQPIPHAPGPNDDARAHLEVYGEIKDLANIGGHQPIPQLEQLIQIYQQILAAKQKKEGQAGQTMPKASGLQKPQVKPFGV